MIINQNRFMAVKSDVKQTEPLNFLSMVTSFSRRFLTTTQKFLARLLSEASVSSLTLDKNFIEFIEHDFQSCLILTQCQMKIQCDLKCIQMTIHTYNPHSNNIGNRNCKHVLHTIRTYNKCNIQICYQFHYRHPTIECCNRRDTIHLFVSC